MNVSIDPNSIEEIFFTEKQKQLIKLMCEGYCNKSIAKVMGVSTRTLERHRKNALITSRCNTIAELIFKFGHVIRYF